MPRPPHHRRPQAPHGEFRHAARGVSDSRWSGKRKTVRRRATLLWLAGVVVICGGLPGCVFRRMTIRSDPPGALAFLDGEEIGYTPVATDFTYYGTREIMLVKDGYETLTTLQTVPAPWYQVVPLDFVSDNLLPFKVTNRHEFAYRLQRKQMPKTEQLLDRANSLRSEALLDP